MPSGTPGALSAVMSMETLLGDRIAHWSFNKPKAACQFLPFCVGGNNLVERGIESHNFSPLKTCWLRNSISILTAISGKSPRLETGRRSHRLSPRVLKQGGDRSAPSVVRPICTQAAMDEGAIVASRFDSYCGRQPLPRICRMNLAVALPTKGDEIFFCIVSQLASRRDVVNFQSRT
jgi:hypothetical protein